MQQSREKGIAQCSLVQQTLGMLKFSGPTLSIFDGRPEFHEILNKELMPVWIDGTDSNGLMVLIPHEALSKIQRLSWHQNWQTLDCQVTRLGVAQKNQSIHWHLAFVMVCSLWLEIAGSDVTHSLPCPAEETNQSEQRQEGEAGDRIRHAAASTIHSNSSNSWIGVMLEWDLRQ